MRTIQRYIEKAPKSQANIIEGKYLNIIMDTTFFGREFGVLVLINSLKKKVIYHRFVKTEKDVYYQLALNQLREKRLYHSISYLRWTKRIIKRFTQYPDTNVPVSYDCDSDA
ncbi:hypothetical protein [Mannheimia sp. USDA-ARS-USMARC-1261]|uniref:hypothetical protein n=1 Tax=Mannheimia sp. USDA-ARS-USMARC-1261 TaxID=1432056 RepID=UPI003FA5D70A